MQYNPLHSPLPQKGESCPDTSFPRICVGFSNHSLEYGVYMIVLTYIYATCLMGFGLYGFYKAGSLISFLSSLAFGIFLFAICIGNNKRWSQLSAPPITLILTLMFALRAYFTQKSLPIVWTVASFILFALFTYRAVKLEQDRRERG